jgi:hypothetical protein
MPCQEPTACTCLPFALLPHSSMCRSRFSCVCPVNCTCGLTSPSSVPSTAQKASTAPPHPHPAVCTCTPPPKTTAPNAQKPPPSCACLPFALLPHSSMCHPRRSCFHPGSQTGGNSPPTVCRKLQPLACRQKRERQALTSANVLTKRVQDTINACRYNC